MSIDLLTSAVFLAILLAPATIPVSTRALYVACNRFETGPEDDPLPEPRLTVALFFGVMMATVPVSGVGICLGTFDMLWALNVYHAPPLAVVAASALAIFGAGICYATLLTAIVPVSCRQAVRLQERIVGPLVALFVPFWGACLL